MDGADLRYLESFERCAIGAGEFRHADHVRVAWALLHQHDLASALGRFSRGLRRFAEHHGASGLYHETITWTYLILIHERMRSLPEGHSWQEFMTASPDLLGDHRRLLARFYSAERLESGLARSTFVMPDRGCAAELPAVGVA